MTETVQEKLTSNKPLKLVSDIDLSFIIVSYKTPSLLAQCIKSIKKSKPDLNYEIIVIDNNSEDNTVEIIEDDFPSVKLIASKINEGFPKAANKGMLKSRGRYILLLNPDITILPGSIEKMIKYMDTHPKTACSSPQLVNPNGSIQNSCFSSYPTFKTVLYRRTFLGNFKRAKKEIDKFSMSDWDHKEGREVAWILGSCMFVRKEAIEEVGVMDERFFMYMEDVDWCRRFWEHNWKVYYYPHVKMVHYYQRASANENLIFSIFNKQTRIHIKSAIKFFRKYSNKEVALPKSNK